jgi:3-hydroxyisobutyrate dehydrogenase
VAAVAEEMLPAMRPAAVWVQVSTVGPAAARQLRDAAASHGISFLDAPVSGSTSQAHQGALVWMVAGPEAAVNVARPSWRAWARKSRSSALPRSQRLKLAINIWLASSTAAIA